MKYFQLAIADDDRWCLAVAGKSIPIDIWACKRVEMPREMSFVVSVEGERVDFDHTGWGAIPVVSRRFAECLGSIAAEDIQCIPASVQGEPDGAWEVLNVLACPDCIDHERSTITYYPPNHAEKPGKPRGVLRLIIDPGRAGGHDVFRPDDWRVAMIVSERAKNLLEAVGTTGVQYRPVTE